MTKPNSALQAGGDETPVASIDALMALARRCLWIAFCWNDHNFDKHPEEYAREEAKKLGIKSFEDANRWLTRPTPAAAAPQQEPTLNLDTTHMDCWQAREAGVVCPICEPCNTGNRDRCLYKRAASPAAAAEVPTELLPEHVDALAHVVGMVAMQRPGEGFVLRAKDAMRVLREIRAASPVAPAGVPSGSISGNPAFSLPSVAKAMEDAVLSAGAPAVPLQDSVHLAVPGSTVPSAAPLSSPRAIERGELPREPLTDTSGRSHPRYAEACAVVRKHKRGSISLVQRHLQTGYNTAAMLLEAMVGDVIAEMPPTTKLLKERK